MQEYSIEIMWGKSMCMEEIWGNGNGTPEPVILYHKTKNNIK